MFHTQTPFTMATRKGERGARWRARAHDMLRAADTEEHDDRTPRLRPDFVAWYNRTRQWEFVER